MSQPPLIDGPADAAQDATPGGARTHRRALVFVIVALVGGSLWLQRAPIAEMTARRYLDGRGIDSRYTIEALSPRRIVLGRIVLGPRQRPDLEAARAVLHVVWRNGVPTPIRLELDRPTLRARVTETGQLSFGSLDALIPTPSAAPIELPDLDLRIARGQLRLITPAGPLRASVDSAGALPDGFVARLTLSPADLKRGDCHIGGLGGRAEVRIVDRVAALAAALAARNGACGDMRAGQLTANLRLRAPERLDRFDGAIRLETADVVISETRLRRAALTIDAAGTDARLSGGWSLTGVGLAAPAGSSDRIVANGRYEAAPAIRQLKLTGALHAQAARLAYRFAAPSALAPTPLGPLAVDAARAVARAAQRFDLRLPLRLDWSGNEGAVRIAGFDAKAASGARLRFVADEDLRVILPSGDLSASGRMTLAGGGLPTMTWDAARLRRVGGHGSAAARIGIAPWRVGGARLTVPRLDLAYADNRLDMQGAMSLSGPLGDGRIENLRLPLDLSLDMRDGFSARVRTRCFAPTFDRLIASGIELRSKRLPLCADGPLLRIGADGQLSGGIAVERAEFAAVLDRQPVRLRMDGLRASWAGTVAAPSLAFRLARPAADLPGLHVTLSEVTGRLQGGRTWTGSGRIVGGAMHGPVLTATFAQANADWTLARDGAVHIANGAVAVRDTAERPRFAPLRIAAIAGVLRDGAIAAAAEARLLADDDRLAGIRLRHDLGRRTGVADLTVEALRFGDSLQPYEVTEFARGVIEDVKGTVSGAGQVRWNPDGVTSDGRLVVDNVSLATAALGPVTGINGTIRFDDLIGLTTPPGQVLTIASLNPGIAVENGTLRFRLLSDFDIGVEGAEWPFAGGTLTLEPTVIAATTADRRYVFNVRNLDAATFMQQFEFKNFNVTGRFDGTLPVVFDAGGGRIVDGRLTARAGGGLVQYVGEVGDGQLGAAARLAFDALKKLRYNALTLGLNGELDGELVTDIRFSGVNEAPVHTGGVLPVAASGVPFRFNVTVRAPFQRLLNSAASFGDARDIIRSGAPVDVDAVPGAAPAKPLATDPK